AWSWYALNDLTLPVSLIMNVFEVLAGVAVIIGWRMRLFSWLLLLLIVFFTFLTGYAVFSGKIKTCGCFGDCIPLTAMQSFIKDLILFVLIVIIFIGSRYIKPVFNGGINFLIVLVSTLLVLGFQWHVFKYLPVID